MDMDKWGQSQLTFFFEAISRCVNTRFKLALTPFILFSFPAYCQQKEQFSTQGSVTTMMLSLAVVIGVILLLAVAFKKLNIHPAANTAVKVISTQPLGTKERIVVVEVNGEQHLLGVTQQSVNHLFKLQEPIKETKPTDSSKAFKDRLQQAIGKQQQD